MKKLLICFLTLFSSPSFSQPEQPNSAYKVFDKNGKEVTLEKVLRRVSRASVIFFGELHSNRTAHSLQQELVKKLYKREGELVIGLEMFEADVQVVLDEYLKDQISEKYFLTDSRAWENYTKDYRPIIQFAKEHQIKVVATNIPRRYANLVYREGLPGLESVSPEARKWMPPLPIEVDFDLPGYKYLATAMKGHEAHGSGKRLVEAQAIKDATMAHFIIQNQSKSFLHINGAFHSRNREGIVWYLNKWKPGLKISTIETVEQENIAELEEEHKNVVDFVICIQK